MRMIRPPLHPRIIQDRRRFLQSTAGAFAAFAASGCGAGGGAPAIAPAPPAGNGGAASEPFAGLVPDPAGILDLREGFSYRVLSRLGDRMDDGFTVPDRADGMGAFDVGEGEIALVRNHELSPGQGPGGPLPSGYRRDANGRVLPGGTTTIVLDAGTLEVRRQFRSLAGTIRNCAGGITPWGTWLTCEEPGSRQIGNRDHGYVFEVPAGASGLVEAQPLIAMGRFNHEAAAVDPATGIVYMTEDREDGLIYRFVPASPGDLAQGGRLQALGLTNGTIDSRNWHRSDVALRQALQVRWIDMDNVTAPDDDLRLRGAAQGALIVARGEGIHMGVGGGVGAGTSASEVYLCATNGGAARLGQIFRLTPGLAGAQDRLDLFFESTRADQLHYGDNLTVAPFGDLIVCEDQSGDGNENRLIGITPAGEAYTFGRLRMATELAGGCFSPDGRWFFVNAYSPSLTVAITGPWNG